MELVDPEYAVFLHATPVNHFAQHIERIGADSKWIITTVTEEAKEQIILPLLEDSVDQVYLRHKEETVQITGKSLEILTEEELMRDYLLSEARKVLDLTFVTPASFKVDGQYQIYPTTRHILQSLIRKFDAVSESTRIYEEGLIDRMEPSLYITGYDLHSTSFPLEGVRIPSFKGKIRIRVKGPNQLAALIHMLLKYGEYSGLGMKCAMGMGAVKLAE